MRRDVVLVLALALALALALVLVLVLVLGETHAAMSGSCSVSHIGGAPPSPASPASVLLQPVPASGASPCSYMYLRPCGNTKGYSSTYVAMGFANVRAGTRYPPEH